LLFWRQAEMRRESHSSARAALLRSEQFLDTGGPCRARLCRHSYQSIAESCILPLSLFWRPNDLRSGYRAVEVGEQPYCDPRSTSRRGRHEPRPRSVRLTMVTRISAIRGLPRCCWNLRRECLKHTTLDWIWKLDLASGYSVEWMMLHVVSIGLRRRSFSSLREV